MIRCTQLVDGFTKEMAEHCALMANRRNTELHSGVLGFEKFDNALWLPATYEVIQVLLKHLGRTLDEFLGSDHATTATAILRDREKSVKKEVLKRINNAKKLFAALGKEDQAKRNERWEKAKTAIVGRPVLREVKCPACDLGALMTGDIVGRGPVRIDEGTTTIEREVRVLPKALLCVHCDLKLDGYQEMREANLGGVYKVIETEDPVEFFSIDPSDYIDPDEFAKEYFAPEYDNE